jgi:hypothetical protein
MRRLPALYRPATFSKSNCLDSHLSMLLCGALLLGIPEMLHAQAVTITGISPSVNFGSVNLCAAGKTTPAPCSTTQTLTYKVTESGTLGATKVVTGGVPNLDFILAEGSTCTGSVTQGEGCVVKVNFTPKYVGLRPGAVQIVDATNTVLVTTFVYGLGVGAQIGFDFGTPVVLPQSGGFHGGVFATDAVGNLFLSGYFGPDSNPDVIVELPAGGGPQITLPFMGPTGYASPIVDGAGDVIALNYTDDHAVDQVVELPAGGGAQFTLPFTAFNEQTGLYSTAVDGAGDVFLVTITSSGTELSGSVLKLPPGGKQITLPFSGLSEPLLVSTDYAGDVFAINYRYDMTNGNTWALLELPAGNLPQKTLTQAPTYPVGLTVDGAGDVFTSGSIGSSPTAFDGLLELPAGSNASIPLANTSNNYVNSLALGPSGDVYFDSFVLQRSQPPPLDFGQIPVDSTTALSLTIQNTGTAPESPQKSPQSLSDPFRRYSSDLMGWTCS